MHSRCCAGLYGVRWSDTALDWQRSLSSTFSSIQSGVGPPHSTALGTGFHTNFKFNDNICALGAYGVLNNVTHREANFVSLIDKQPAMYSRNSGCPGGQFQRNIIYGDRGGNDPYREGFLTLQRYAASDVLGIKWFAANLPKWLLVASRRIAGTSSNRSAVLLSPYGQDGAGYDTNYYESSYANVGFVDYDDGNIDLNFGPIGSLSGYTKLKLICGSKYAKPGPDGMLPGAFSDCVMP